jgi:hypothetical protein
MPTISELGHVDSRQVAIAAPREVAFALLADARRFPEWAPNFARAVRAEGEDWAVDTGAGELLVRVLSDAEQGTVDIVRPSDPAGGGARMRVLANGAGSAFVFTMVFPPGTPDAAIAAQMATIEDELETVRALAQAAATAAA